MDDLADFEFFNIILDKGSRKLRLPDRFASALDGRDREPLEVKLREAGGGRHLWDAEVVFDGDGHMYIGRGWDQFTLVHDLQLGHFLVFSYDGDDAVLTVKVFNGSMCRRHYQDDDTNSGSSSDGGSGSTNSSEGNSGGNNSSTEEMEMAIDDAPTSQFTVMLRQCHLGVRQKQYLNVPLEFQFAHGYAERSKVVLRMRGKSWIVNVKHGPRAVGNPLTSLRYGWHQFCVDNRLGVGDTCFFRALRGGDAGCGEDHVLKVEVRKRDGTFAHRWARAVAAGLR